MRRYPDHKVEQLPWDWKIPGALLSWNEDDFSRSIEHHYGVRFTTIYPLQPTLTGWERGLDSLLSRRLRKVLTLFEEAQKPVEFQDDRGSTEQL